ncbi:MAG: TonB-dependent receptor [Bacteroidetes bacterium]|nr:TonB-dependent receptor [Bacteroidota bacterium]
MKKFLSLLISLSALSAYAQNGTVRGQVMEDASGQPIIAADVLVVGHPIGASTDLDGKFSISMPAGTYKIMISYIGLQEITVENVIVKAGEVTVVDPVRLAEPSTGETLGVAVVQVKTAASSESSLISVRRKSAQILDGISSAKMDMVGDGTAVEAAKRVTGVSVEDGKYVYVRGLGDRYTKTMLNGVDIPGLDPDKNSLQMDIFPTNLIDKITVSKNFTANLPADYTGGLLNIETKDFPEEKIFNVSIGTAVNPQMHFNPNYLMYKGSATDFLGFDNGKRALPENARGSEIPTPLNPDYNSAQVNKFVSSFDPTLGATQKTSLMDLSASVTIGNQFQLGKTEEAKKKNRTIGYIFSAAYKSNYKFYDSVVYGEYQRYKNPEVTDLRYATMQTGAIGERDFLIGLLGGVAYKTQYSKIRLNVMHLQSGESRAAQFTIRNDGEAVGQSGYYAKSDNLEYNQRGLTNIILVGTHIKPKKEFEVEWRVSPTISSSQDPDIRKTAFTYTNIDTFFNAGAGGNPTRIWRSLNEISNTSKIDFTKNYLIKERDSKFQWGFSHVYKARNYEILFFDVQFFGSQKWTSDDPNQVLAPGNIYPNKPNNIYYQSGNNDPNPNEYSSDINNFGAYVSNEFQVTKKLKTIVGLRGEKYIQHHTGRDQRYASGDPNGNNLENAEVLNSFDLFPSLNLIYAYTEKANLRLTYGKTIARPSFKEMSYAQIIDPLTNRIFNGTLFQYNQWDGQLVETRIQNIDFRWEVFQKRNQMISVSTFYKQFEKPIELVRIPEQQTSTEYQPRNVGNGQLFGVELEIQKHLTFISPRLQKYMFSGNITFVKSQIAMTEVEFDSRKSYEKAGETIKNTRAMAGQAPYVINAGISYNDYESGFNAGMFYNVKGPTLYIVGAGLFPDIYNEPFHSLNFSINQKLGAKKTTVIDFKVANILNDRIESFYKSFEAEKQVFSSINPGPTFSFGVKHAF